MYYFKKYFKDISNKCLSFNLKYAFVKIFLIIHTYYQVGLILPNLFFKQKCYRLTLIFKKNMSNLIHLRLEETILVIYYKQFNIPFVFRFLLLKNDYCEICIRLIQTKRL